MRTSLTSFGLFVTLAACGATESPPDGAGGGAGTGGTQAGASGAGAAGTAGTLAGAGGASASGGSAGAAAGGAGTGGSAGTSGTSGAAGAGSGSGGAAGGAGSGGSAGSVSGGSSGGGAAGSAGSAGDAGSAGSSGASGTAGTAGAAGSTSGDCQGFSICDDFEAASSPTSPPWTVQLGYSGTDGQAADVALDATLAHSGSQSMKFSGTTNPRFITTAAPSASGPIYIRAFTRLSAVLGQNHITLIAVSDASDNEIRVGGQNGFLHANLSMGDGLTPNPFVPCDICLAPPANEWFCLEAMFDFAASHVTVWVNDTVVVDADEVSDWHSGTAPWPGTPTELKFGYQSFGGDSATVWMDDVAVGSQRAGCE